MLGVGQGTEQPQGAKLEQHGLHIYSQLENKYRVVERELSLCLCWLDSGFNLLFFNGTTAISLVVIYGIIKLSVMKTSFIHLQWGHSNPQIKRVKFPNFKSQRNKMDSDFVFFIYLKSMKSLLPSKASIRRVGVKGIQKNNKYNKIKQ